MKFMFDTTICIDVIRKRPRSVLDRFADHAVGDIGVSTITLAELEYGVSASSQPTKNREALDQFMSPLECTAACAWRSRREAKRSVRWTC
jgi:tRNA(fMet)-specific endonuclease VapC